MRSVFCQEKTVEQDGEQYVLEADVTMDGVEIFRVRAGDRRGICRRDGDRALLTPVSTLTHAMEDALAQEVEVVIPEGVTRAQTGDGERGEPA